MQEWLKFVFQVEKGLIEPARCNLSVHLTNLLVSFLQCEPPRPNRPAHLSQETEDKAGGTEPADPVNYGGDFPCVVESRTLVFFVKKSH